MKSKSQLQRNIFFDNQLHNKRWKESMSGKTEELAIKILNCLQYKQGEDYVRQYPIANAFVLDFAFVKERVALEIDGKSHRNKSQIIKDEKRDKFLRTHNWVTIRIQDKNLKGEKRTFCKYFIQEIIEERRKCVDGFSPQDIPDYYQG